MPRWSQIKVLVYFSGGRKASSSVFWETVSVSYLRETLATTNVLDDDKKSYAGGNKNIDKGLWRAILNGHSAMPGKMILLGSVVIRLLFKYTYFSTGWKF